MAIPSNKLFEDFERYFTVDLAHNEDLKNKVFGIRYRVYCEEFKYETTDHFPNRLEKDEYDDISMHCLITHKATGTPAGCVRLVPTLETQPDFALPLEKYCQESIDQDAVNRLEVVTQDKCELSRLAVDQMFRRRPGENATRFGGIQLLDAPIDEQRTFPLIAVSAFVAAIALTDLSGRTSVFAMMEPFLPRLLKRSGINFVQIGNEMDYHGKRAPYFLDACGENTVSSELRSLYHWIKNQLAPGYLAYQSVDQT